MNGVIYLVQENGELLEMRETAYNSEAVLQTLLAKYPNLLAGEQMNAVSPRRWLLVSQEMGVPGEEEGSDRWYLDHLFLDQDAIPTLIEVKRSTDTRIRREVIGQMLDYAANAVVYWPVEAIRARFEEQCRTRSVNPSEVLEQHMDVGADEDEYWQRVKTNLQAGRIRLVFVADIIPQELLRIVEFLNGQMDPAEVLAIEVKQFVGQELTTLVPRLVGKTIEADQRKGGARLSGKQWDEESFFQDLKARRGEAEYAAARGIFDWAKQKMPRFSWGKGRTEGSFFPVLDHRSQWHTVIAIWSGGNTEIQFQHMLSKQPFDDKEKRLELLKRLNHLPGISLPIDAITRRPGIRLSKFVNEDFLRQLLSILDWYVAEVLAT